MWPEASPHPFPPPPSLRFTSVNEENISPWFLGCLLVLSRVIHARDMLVEAVSFSFFQGLGLAGPYCCLYNLTLGCHFWHLRLSSPVVLCVLTFSGRFWGRIGPMSSLCVSPFADIHLPQPWERKPDHLKWGTSWLFFSFWQNTKHHHPFPPSPFVPLQTLPRFWREGEVILCMCEPAFW